MSDHDAGAGDRVYDASPDTNASTAQSSVRMRPMKFAHGAGAQRPRMDLGVELVELFAKIGDGNTMRRSASVALVEELREVYLNAVTRIVDLFACIAANNETQSELHQARPVAVMQHLLSESCMPTGSIVSLATRRRFSLRFACSIGAWPPPWPSIAAAFAATPLVPAYARRFTAN